MLLGRITVIAALLTPVLAAQTSDLSLTMTAAPNPVAAGAHLTYTLTVTNTGPDAASGVSVEIAVSPLVSPVSCIATAGGVCNPVGSNVTFASLAADASALATIVVNVAAGTANGSSIVTTATVDSSMATSAVTVAAPPLAITLSTLNLSFPSELLRQASAPQSVTLTNAGAQPLNLAGISGNSGDFSVTSTCSVKSALAAGASCAIQVRFAPETAGIRTGAITIADNAPDSPQSISVTGVGVALEASPTSLTFAATAVGARSEPAIVRLTNRARTAIHTTISIGGSALSSGDFVRAASDDACPTTGHIEAGDTCTMAFVFAPLGGGARAGSVSVTDDVDSSPQSITLAGTGKAVRLSSGALSFGRETIGLTSAITIERVSVLGDTAVNFPLTALGPPSVSIGGANPGDFAVKADGCGGRTVPGGGACQIGIAFAPTADGDRDAVLVINDTDAGSPQKVSLSGTGLKPVLTGITIQPGNGFLGTGATSQLTAIGAYSNGLSKDVTALAHWESSNSDAARVSNQGLATGVEPGKTSIAAGVDDVRAQIALTVFVQPHISFTVQPTSASVSAVIAPAVRVRVVDYKNSPLAGQMLTLSIGPNPPNPASITGTIAMMTDATGSATFSDLRLDYLGHGYTLMATATTVGGPFSALSTPFNENRVGDACLGPTPACSSGCHDTDGDGLNDEWEIAGGIDLNGDGKISAQYDLLLPDANPLKQDVYVQYNWMDYSVPGNACSADADCRNISLGHAGETCSGPRVSATASGSCRYACTADADCTARGAGHLQEKCEANSCVHTHDPDFTAPGALQAVVDSFAAHGINLHIIRGQALPHSLVVSFRQNSVMEDRCEGGSMTSGTAGPGKYAVSLYDLKAASSLDRLKIAYHYALFSHYSGCDTAADCNSCPRASNPDGSAKNQPVSGESGLSEVSGNDLVVSLGGREQDLLIQAGTFTEGATFMHELGHNLGLRHGGGIDTPCTTVGAACPISGICTATPVGNLCLGGEELNSKPNYLSVMNYRYQFTGIQSASVVGSNVPASSRLDYSTQTLPTGGNTPGRLDQSTVPNLPAAGDPGLGLSEPAGLGSGMADLFTFTNALETGIPHMAASQGPVDWNGDGALVSTNVQADTSCGPAGFGDHPCSVPQYPQLNGHTDWGPAGQNTFTYKFQCTPYGGLNGDGASTPTTFLQHEMNTEMAMQSHVALPLRAARIAIRPGCSGKLLAPGQPGAVTVAVLGADDFNVAEIDLASLGFHGASLVSTFIQDVDGDGRPDLIALFDMRSLKLDAAAKAGRLTGWLKNSQGFIGEDQISVVPSMSPADASCGTGRLY